ncbi:ABC transporter substrate-binding protein [Solimonas soli]|uniref:ABC transporter substrate-binding protein n=1 Tax=Solimonas soli TaxID=413479 RepID=UPI0004B2993A|nr:ABC transporter substrate-binding protein [Solimonas soli]
MPASIDKIWYTSAPVPTPLGLASQLGWFLDEFRGDGIGVYTLREGRDDGLHRSHYDHSLEHSFRQGGSAPAMWARAEGRRTRVIGLNWIDEFQAIIALPHSGIRKLRDLKGRRLALPRRRGLEVDHERAAALRGSLVALEIAGLTQADVAWLDIVLDRPQLARPTHRILNNRHPLLANALRECRADAVYVKGPQGAQLVAELGATVLLDIRAHPDPFVRANHGAPRPLTVDQHLLDARPDIVERFLRRVVDAGEWAEAHPAETLAYVARETHADERWVRAAYGDDLHRHQHTNLDEQAITALAAYQRFLYLHGFLPGDFDLRAWIATEPLQAILRERTARAA